MSILGDSGNRADVRRAPAETFPEDERRSGSSFAAAAFSQGARGRVDPAREASVTVVQEDMRIQGEIRNCPRIEIYGFIEGELTAETVLIHQNGKLHGTVRAGNAEIHGTLQGEAFVRDLVDIRRTGSVSGNVQYGRLAMEEGANLSADVRNVPPKIAGDLDLTVEKGRSVRISTEDLTAIDPDDAAEDPTYAVSTVAVRRPR